MSTQVTYVTDHIFLFCDSTMSSALFFFFIFYFFVFYCDLEEKDHIRRNINSKKRNAYM